MRRSSGRSGGEALIDKLAELGLSQTDLAARVDATGASVSRWISGERTPTLEMAFRIEDVIGLSPAVWRPRRPRRRRPSLAA
jgi:plasmid maintenance system antidote protein VapI